jgi:Bromodomain
VSTLLKHCCVLGEIADRTEDTMSDSDDSSPRRLGGKRRRLSSRPALPSDPNLVTTDEDKVQSPISTSYEVSESDIMFTNLRAKLEDKKRRNQHEALAASAAQIAVDQSRSALREKEHERGELKAALIQNRAEIEQATVELSDLERECESKKAATLANDSTHEKAATAVKEFGRVDKELHALLQPTEFGSKKASIKNMLRGFHQDVDQTYFPDDGHDEGANPKPSYPQQLDNDTLEKLRSVMRGLRGHKAYPMFAQPVTEEIAPNYFKIIKHPIDLSMIREKLSSAGYTSYLDFVVDVKLMFTNCRTYNPPGSDHVRAANDLEQQIHRLLKKRGLEGL